MLVYQIIIKMKILILLLLCLLGGESHIYSSDSKVTYDYDGNPRIYHIYFSLEYGLGDSDYLSIIWPFQMSVLNHKDQLHAKLISFSNNLEIVDTNFQLTPNDASLQYNIKFGVALTAKKWYQVQIFPTNNPATTPYHGLIQLKTVSSLLLNKIVYDSNLAFGYISIAAPSLNIGGITVGIARQSDRAAAIHTVTIDITPAAPNTNGGNFTLSIHYDPLDTTNHNDATLGSTGELDFKFMGLCQSVDAGSGVAEVLNYCEISDDLTQIYFSASQLTGNKIRIQTQVSNPLFQSTRGIRAYYVDFISGMVVENGYLDVALTVEEMLINDLNNERVYLLWGIDTDYVSSDSDLNALNLALYKASSTAVLGPFNSFNIGFSFDETSPIDGHYRVRVTLESTGFLEGSLAHNLPAYSNLKVYCHYEDPDLVCENVGPFIRTGHRYFVSGKAYYANGKTGPLTTFGDIKIQPIVYNSAGVQQSVTLYAPFTAGDSIDLRVSEEFLDTSGFHSQSLRKIGVAQIVSHYDDGTLSSTANAVKDFLTGSNSTIGIVPDLGVSQQLLFLMKVGSVGTGNQFHMRILYNNKAIGFETDAEERGLDFVGYSATDSEWSIEYAPCHVSGKVVCEKYNVDTPDKNKQWRVNTDQDNNFYGLYKFQCGSAYVPSPVCHTDCPTACNLFTGYNLIDYKTSVISMRKVTFSSTQFHSSLYADDSLLDFVVVFIQGSTFVSSSLINAYTMVGTKMQNIKASYVNYFEDTSQRINKGTRIPTMIRIAGGVLPAESRNATVIGVFFDDNMDASSFYTHIDESYEVGCSTDNCLYYPNEDINLDRNNIWHTMKRVQFYDIPPIQNQFNILVPVTPSANRYASDPVPDTLTIAFFTKNNSIADATGLLQTVSVYRLFGPVVTGSISGALTSVNSMTRQGYDSNMNSDFSSTYISYGSYLGYSLNRSNVLLSPPDNTFGYGYANTITVNNQYGGGVTLTSLYYNIFEASTLYFETPPANTATTCTIFGYVYNEVSLNPERNGQWIYTAFCPIDSTKYLYDAGANIHIKNPQYPNVFTTNFQLRSIISYAISNADGKLLAYKHETQALNTFSRTCTTAKLHPYNPSSTGKQRATFTISTPQIRMSQSGYDGYSTFKIILTLPGTTTSLTMQSECYISDPDLSCTASGSPTSTITVTYTGNDVMTVTYFELQLFAITSGSLGTQGDYNIQIRLPQYISTYVPFGTSYASYTTYCTCSSTFKIGTTSYQQLMVYQEPVVNSDMMGVKSPIQFNFGSLSYREAFFDTSYYQFDFGFLYNLANAAKLSNNFRCLVYLNSDGILTPSTKWKTIDYSSLTAVRLYPKQTFDEPASYLFTMKCLGAGVPTGPSANSMSLSWKEAGSVSVQTATNIPMPNYSGTVSGSFTTPPTIHLIRFSNVGMKAFYTFTLRSSAPLDENSKIYFDFNLIMNSRLQQQGKVECYIRETAATSDANAVFSYCQFTYTNQLVIWNNIPISNTAAFYIDIFNIDLPKNTDISPNIITVSLDLDSDYINGVHSIHQLTNTPSDNTAIADILITETSMNTTYIRSPQTITIFFTTFVDININEYLYLLLPASYGEWINRGQTVEYLDQTIYVENTGSSGVNIAGASLFISKRVLKIKIRATALAGNYKLILNDIFSPASIPSGRYNQYRFKLFTANLGETLVTAYSFSDHSKHLTLQSNSELIDLSWRYHQISIVDSLVSTTDISEETFIIYVGYYSNFIELRQSIYPLNFQAELTLSLNKFSLTDDILIKEGPIIKLGIKNAYLRFAAVSSSTSIIAGLFTFQFTKSGDTQEQYTEVAPLTVVVSNKKCKLATEEISYPLPLGGFTLPIKISAISCIPVTDITIELTYSSSEISTDSDLSTSQITSESIDGQAYFIAKHVARGGLSIGSVVTVTFTITGTEANSYDEITSISLTIVDPTAYQTLPTATSLTYPTLSYNKATFTLQCSMASKIYWGLGIYPSILNSQALDFQARIISEKNGLLTNFTEPQDLYQRVYGVNYVATTQTLKKTVYNLKSNSQYIFKYYCINQMGLISDSQSLTFTSLNYGAYLMKVSITFRGSLTYLQYHDLTCSLAQNFKIPYARIMTEVMSSCGVTNTIFYPTTDSVIQKQANSNGEYVYNFYILPDYSIPIDNTNSDIRSALSLSSTSTKIITSTNDFINLPQTIQMQSEDIQFFTSPSLSFSDPLSGLNSVVVDATITNMNGFIVIGCMQGTFDSTTMTLPTPANIKKGLFQQNKPLKGVKMMYTIQNYKTTFSFTGLDDNKQYTFFYYATGEDPTITAQSTSVSVFNAQTLQALTVNINWQGSMRNILWICLLMLVMLMF